MSAFIKQLKSFFNSVQKQQKRNPLLKYFLRTGIVTGWNHTRKHVPESKELPLCSLCTCPARHVHGSTQGKEHRGNHVWCCMVVFDRTTGRTNGTWCMFSPLFVTVLLRPCSPANPLKQPFHCYCTSLGWLVALSCSTFPKQPLPAVVILLP